LKRYAPVGRKARKYGDPFPNKRERVDQRIELWWMAAAEHHLGNHY
jgi:hypothetical protein